MNQRLHDAVVAAQEAFWAKIAAAFPEATSGDFPPGDQLAFDAACMSAATVWVEGNCKTACKTFQVSGVISVQKLPPWVV